MQAVDPRQLRTALDVSSVTASFGREHVAVAQNHQSGRIVVFPKEILLTVRHGLSLRSHAGRAQGN
jgi:hypothetical protein